MKHMATILLIGITTGATIFALSSIEPIRDWFEQINVNAVLPRAVEASDVVMPPAFTAPSRPLPVRDLVPAPEVVVAAPVEVVSIKREDPIVAASDASVDKEAGERSSILIASELNIESKAIRDDDAATKQGPIQPSHSNPKPEEGFKRLNDNLSAMGDALAEFNEKLKERMKR